LFLLFISFPKKINIKEKINGMVKTWTYTFRETKNKHVLVLRRDKVKCKINLGIEDLCMEEQTHQHCRSSLLHHERQPYSSFLGQISFLVMFLHMVEWKYERDTGVHLDDPCSRLGHLQRFAQGCLNKNVMGARSCWPGLMKMHDDLIKHLSARTQKHWWQALLYEHVHLWCCLRSWQNFT
jgi:hypothetical protein